jgi:hypothetical protein
VRRRWKKKKKKKQKKKKNGIGPPISTHLPAAKIQRRRGERN